MRNPDIKDEVRAYIVDSFLAESAVPLNDQDDLLALLDSLQLLRMVIDFERRYSLKVATEELTAGNFGSVEKLAAFLGRKQVTPCAASM
jgi:acyl carrier protein